MLHVQINTNGILSFGSSFNSTNPEKLPVSQTTPPFIAGFWSNLTLSQESLIAIAERSPASTDYLYTRACMSQFLHEGFGGSAADYDPTHFVIVTWKDVTHHISESTVSLLVFTQKCVRRNCKHINSTAFDIRILVIISASSFFHVS